MIHFKDWTLKMELHLESNRSLHRKKKLKNMIEIDAGYSPAESLMKIEILCRLIYFVCLGALISGHYLKVNLVSLCDGNAWIKPGGMNKIIISVVSSYKSKMLCSVKELYCSCYHF
jgi:hypothetical protein